MYAFHYLNVLILTGMEECCSKIELEDGRSLYFSIKGVELEGMTSCHLNYQFCY